MSISGILASSPKHQVTLPMSGKKVEYRPFVVKEEKILLMAAETKDEKTINSAVREVILSCTGGKVDVLKVPILDMEYLFLHLRSNSVGETSKPNIKCEKCEVPNECEIKLSEIVPITDPSHKKVIPLVGDISVVMRYPTLEDVDSIGKGTDVERSFSLIVACIEKIIQGERIYLASEVGEDDVRAFIGEMTQAQFKKVLDFLATMPRLEKEISFKCSSCGHQNDQTIRGIASFF